MMNDIKKNELNEQEMNGVAGGFGGSDAYRVWEQMQRELQKQEEARQEAIRQAEAANQPGAHAHGGGASGGW